MAEKYILTAGYFDGQLIIHHVVSETEKQLKTHEGSPYSGRFEGQRLSTVARSKVIAEFPGEDEARAAMARAKAAWDRAAGPVGDAKRILSQRQERQRADWLAALATPRAAITPTPDTGTAEVGGGE